MKTAIILVTYNRFDLTNACLRCLLPLLNRGFEIAIADNGSTDNTVQKIKEQFPQVHVFELFSNKGFGAANNFAVRRLIEKGVEFDSICLLNNDTIPKMQTLPLLQQALSRYNSSHPEEAIIAPRIKSINGREQKNYYTDISWFQFVLNAFRTQSMAAKYLHGSLTPSDDPTLLEAYWINAVCLMMSRSLWEKIGGFDERIFMYYEDMDFALRAKKQSAHFLIEMQSILTHLGGGSSKNSLSQALQHDQSQEYVFYKHHGFIGKIASKKFRFFRSFLRVATGLPFYIFFPSVQERVNIHFNLLKNIFKKK